MDYCFTNQECSSGCESGWTLYLEYSSISSYNQEKGCLDARTNGFLPEAKRSKHDDDDDEDEDLSMVSDASSGPPHLHEDQEEVNDTNGYFCHYRIDNAVCGKSFNTKKNREKRRRKGQDQSPVSLLDDTASSPFYGYSNKSLNQLNSVENVLEYSQGYSTTRFEVRQPSYQEHYDFLQCSPSGNQLQQNQRW